MDSQHKQRPTMSFWDDPVYHYLSRQHQSALDSGNDLEAETYDKHMQDIVNQSMSDNDYWRLDEEAKTDRKNRKQERKQNQRQKRPPINTSTTEGSINTADLKKNASLILKSREKMSSKR